MAVLFVLLIFVGILALVGGIVSLFRPMQPPLAKASILQLDLHGVIGDDEKFLERLKKYRDDDNIKGVLVSINSPGGIVGPSQAIYMELKRTREEFQKPVVVAGLGLMASGAYYAAVAADKIVVTPGCLVGSIGAIMPFVNLERLMDWAKIQRYSVKTGKYKDMGAEYRPMSEEERQLLQGLLDGVLVQFKGAIKDGRKLNPNVIDENADGRIFTGEEAVKLGFADQMGTLEDGRRLLGSLTGLGDDPNVFKPRASRIEGYLPLLDEESEGRSGIRGWLNDTFQLKLRGQPLLIWPMYLGL